MSQIETFTVGEKEITVQAIEHTKSQTLDEVDGDPVIKWSFHWISQKNAKTETRLGFSKLSNTMLAKMMPNHRKTFFLDSLYSIGGAATHQFYYETLPSYEEVKSRVSEIIANNFKAV